MVVQDWQENPQTSNYINNLLYGLQPLTFHLCLLRVMQPQCCTLHGRKLAT